MDAMVDLTDDQLALRDMVAALAADRYAPMAHTWDEARTPLPHIERKRLGELGLLGITMPADVGGEARPLLDALIALEELAKASPIAAWPVFESNAGPARIVEQFGTAEQKHRFLPAVVSGDKTIALSISEPDAGTAATDMRTSGRIEGDHVVINGMKRWCSGAGHAEQYLVYLRLDDSVGSKAIGAAVVDADTPGIEFGQQEALMGFRGIGSADIYFQDVRVPIDNVIVPAGGFKRLFTGFSIERLGNATMSLAIAQSALDRSARYIVDRKQFGRPIAEFQLVQATLAEMVVQVEGARLLLYAAARGAGTGAPSPLAASIAKCAANEAAKAVSDRAMQLHGGYGYSAEYEIERLHRDAHGWAIAGGTVNIQKVRIAGEYLRTRFDQRR